MIGQNKIIQSLAEYVHLFSGMCEFKILVFDPVTLPLWKVGIAVQVQARYESQVEKVKSMMHPTD